MIPANDRSALARRAAVCALFRVSYRVGHGGLSYLAAAPINPWVASSIARASSVARISSRTSSPANTWSQRRARTRSISAIRSAGRVLLLCAGVAKMQQCSSGCNFFLVYTLRISSLFFLVKFHLRVFAPGETGFRYPGGDHLGRETAATAHSGLYADTVRTRNSMHIRNYLCVKDIQLFSC
jgi:hypothetical protein